MTNGSMARYIKNQFELLLENCTLFVWFGFKCGPSTIASLGTT